MSEDRHQHTPNIHQSFQVHRIQCNSKAELGSLGSFSNFNDGYFFSFIQAPQRMALLSAVVYSCLSPCFVQSPGPDPVQPRTDHHSEGLDRGMLKS